MRTIKPKLIHSTNSLESLLDLTIKYFFGSSIQLGSDGEVWNSKGRLNQFRWTCKNGRFRLERIEY